MARLEVIYAARVQPGDLIMGYVDIDAPSRPAQPMAHGLTVESVEVTADPDNPRRKFYTWTWTGGLGSASPRPATAQVMVLR